MSHRGAIVGLAAAIAVLGFALAELFRLRVASGSVFPEYSSLRADPLGVRALHDSLAQLPGMTVDRQLRALDSLASEPGRTIFLPGITLAAWRHFPADAFDALDRAARTGCRVVITFRAVDADDDFKGETPSKPKTDGDNAKKNDEKRRDPDEGSDDEDASRARLADIQKRWGVETKLRPLAQLGGGAARVGDPPISALPERLQWQSDVYFALTSTAGWRPVYRRGIAAVMVERSLGKGSVVLAGDSYFLSNEALQRDRSTSLLTWLVGSHRHVTFDESHLGVMEKPGVAALARRYGLTGAFFTFAVLAGLFVWQRGAVFVPATDPGSDIRFAYHPAAGLESLLRRAVPPGELFDLCLKEWRRTARASEIASAEAALRLLRADASAIERYNAVVRALRRRR